MGYWGWRPLALIFCISVWVTGCHIASETTLTDPPTQLPPITLTVRLRPTILPPSPPTPPPAATRQDMGTPVADAGQRVAIVRPGDTLLGIALEFGVAVEVLRAANPNVDPRSLQVGQQLIIPISPPNGIPTFPPLIGLVLPVPICYPLPTERTLCLGEVQNPLPFAAGGVIVRVQLLDRQLNVVGEQHTGLEQTLVLPGMAAPYAVTFALEWEENYQVVTTLLRALERPAALVEHFTPLVVEDEQAILEGRRYVLQASVYNPTSKPTGPVLLVMTVRDALQQIVGYRAVIIAHGLMPGERHPILLEVIPQPGTAPLAHSLYIEARLIDA